MAGEGIKGEGKGLSLNTYELSSIIPSFDILVFSCLTNLWEQTYHVTKLYMHAMQ